jgi:hypothetical protein
LGDQIDKNEVDGTCSTYGEWSGVYRVLVGKPEVKRSLGRLGVDRRIILRFILGSGM